MPVRANAATGALLAIPGATRAQLLITEKVSFDENTGKTITHPAGHDVDHRHYQPLKPNIVTNLPLMNTINGPPVNLAIRPDRYLALVANSLEWVKDGDGGKGVPDTGCMSST